MQVFLGIVAVGTDDIFPPLPAPTPHAQKQTYRAIHETTLDKRVSTRVLVRAPPTVHIVFMKPVIYIYRMA